MVLYVFVLCFGVKCLCCLNLMYVFIVLGRLGNRVTAYWEIAARSAYDTTKYLVSHLGFWCGSFH